MRAGMFVEALAQTHRVSLMLVPLFAERTDSAAAFIAHHCAEVFVVETEPAQPLKPRADAPLLLQAFERYNQAAARVLGDARFDVIHAQRLYLAPLALSLAQRAARHGRPALHLDLDDVESVTHTRLADLCRVNLQPAWAEAETLEAARYSKAERAYLPRFDRVYVCSEADAAAIASLTAGDVRVVPNAVRPPEVPPQRLTTHAFRFLFLGNLDYYPNQDAVRFFCTEVVPLLRRRAKQPFRVRIAGAGLTDALTSLGGIPEVWIAGRVPEAALEYGEANAVIVPIRAGGGTRIKVLEAFAHGRPVVSTTIGMEGIAAEPGHDFLLGDTPEALTEQCLRLMEESELPEAVAGNAATLVRERYSQAVINRLIAGWT
jgi:glycosyltransferase involved in cell wall biosynthesis